MNAAQVVCHLADPLRVLLHKREVKSVVPFFLQQVVRMIVFTGKPWAPGTPTFKPFSQDAKGEGTRPVDFETDKATLLQLFQEFCATNSNYKFAKHPGLGRLSRARHGLFIWKHMDHHLRQFGV